MKKISFSLVGSDDLSIKEDGFQSFDLISTFAQCKNTSSTLITIQIFGG